MKPIKQLREQREEALKALLRLRDKCNDEGQEWLESDEEHWQEANADYNRLEGQLEKAERCEELETKRREEADARYQAEARGFRQSGRTVHPRGRPGAAGAAGAAQGDADDLERMFRPQHQIDRRDWDLALAAWAMRGENRESYLPDQMLDACRRTGINPDASQIEIQLRTGMLAPVSAERRWSKIEERASTTATEGGETVPEGFVANFEEALLDIGDMRRVAEIIRTTGGAPLPWPTSDDTGNVAEDGIAEGSGAAEVDITTGEMVLNAFKTGSLVKSSWELLEDSAFNLAAIIGRMLGTRIARRANEWYTTGDGSGEPNGIVTAATAVVAPATQTAIGATNGNSLIDFLHSVDPAYRRMRGAGFMMHDTILGVVRKIRDDNGMFLWQGSLRDGIPDTLLGYPVAINQNMAATDTASSKIIIFGSLTHYKIRDVGSVRLRRLDELYAAADQVGFSAHFRTDGDLLDAGTAPVKVYQNAAS